MTRPFSKLVLPLASLTVVSFLWSSASSAGTVQISSDPFTNPLGQHMTEVEPHVFANGSTIVATFQQGRFEGGGGSDIGWATSIDNGATWRDGFLPGVTIFSGGDRYLFASDAAVAYNRAYGLWLIESLPLGAEPTIFVSRSADGLLWDNPVTVAQGSTPSFFDKPWIACDNTLTSPFYGNCYVEWDDIGQGGGILMSTSTDGGATWGPALLTADEAVGLGGQPLVFPSGRVVVPYLSFGAEIRSFISDDGGRSWNASVLISEVAQHIVAGNLRAPAVLPSAAIDGDGKIYVAWGDCRFRPSCRANDIVISTSSDGVAWSDLTRVPIDATTTRADHFLPGLGADQNTFAPNVSLALVYYYYPEADCTEQTCQLIGGFITSRDGLDGWSAPRDVTGPMAIDWLANTTQGRMVGDYFATCFTSDGAPHPVFAGAVAPTDQFLESMFTTCAGCDAPGLALAGAADCLDGNCRPNSEEKPVAKARATVEPRESTGLRLVAKSTRINIGTSLPLHAQGAAIQSAALQWAVEEGSSGGSVSDSGVYKAPLTPGFYHVIARSGEEEARLTIEVFTVQ